MRLTILTAALLAAIGGGAAQAHHQQLTLALAGPLQARFAGYYVADYQGFYDEGEVAVAIEPGGDAVQALADGRANIVVATLPEALAARARGLALVNIGQIFKRSGAGLTCRRDAGITEPHDLAGKKVGLPPDGDPYPLRAWMRQLGLKTDGSAKGITVVDQGDGVGLLLQRQADCISTETYDQQLDLEDAGLRPEDLTVFGYQDEGVATLADGLYVLAKDLKDADHVQTLGAFLHHTMRGWLWARENPVEAARIVLEYDTGHTLTEKRQVRMMDAIDRLVAGSTGALDQAAFAHTVKVMAAGGAKGTDAAAKGAWSHKVADAANLAKLF